MKNREYDEVMIVNPYDPQATNQETKLMTFHDSPEMGYYAAPEHYGYYADEPAMGYYADPYGDYADAYGYYGDSPDFGWYADSPDMGYYADPGYGYYSQPDLGYGYYGEPAIGYYGEPAFGYYGDPYGSVGYYADELPMGWYGDGSDMAGYDDYADEMGDYGDPTMEGYVRQTAPAYNPGCPIPTNVAGYGEGEQLGADEPFAGYQRPMTVNASCGQFSPQPGVSDAMPETFKPLW